MLVLVNVIRGQCSTSRKFDERMSLSLIPLLVRMLAVEIVASTFAVSGWSGSMSAVVLTSAKCPRTVIIPRCFAENSTCVWYGSSCQLPMWIPSQDRSSTTNQPPVGWPTYLHHNGGGQTVVPPLAQRSARVSAVRCADPRRERGHLDLNGGHDGVGVGVRIGPQGRQGGGTDVGCGGHDPVAVQP